MSLMIFRGAFSCSISGARMPNQGRVLAFPSRQSAKPLSRAEALARAAEYLALPTERRTTQSESTHLDDADTLSSICAILRDRLNVAPAEVFAEAKGLY